MTTTNPTTRRPAVWQRIDDAVDAFEEQIRLNGSCDVIRFCPPPDDADYAEIATELIRVDLEWSRTNGRPRTLDDYRRDYPDLFADPDRLRLVAYEEYRLRLAAGEDVSADDYRLRYGISIPGEIGFDPASMRDPTSILAPDAVPRVVSDRARPPLDPSELAPGDEWMGFRLVRELGRGTFARVFLAEQLDMANRAVVLKLSSHLPHESQTLARLQHTNIVPIHSVHRANGLQAICMPYFGSATLADVIRTLSSGAIPSSSSGIVSTLADRMAASTVTSADSLPTPSLPQIASAANPFSDPLAHMRSKSHIEAVLEIAIELADGLAFAHDLGIVHRDLKPANVLMNDCGHPMLLDFNLASDGSPGELEAIAGTPSHMSPEQLALAGGQPTAIDHRSDLYSLGLVLYELLTGRPAVAIPKGTAGERIRQLREGRSGRPPAASAVNRNVPPALDSIVAKCLEPVPGHRYATAHQLREDLHRQRTNRPLTFARNTSLRERGAKFIRRNPWLKSLPFIAVLLALSGTAVAAFAAKAYWERERTLALNQYQDFVTPSERLTRRLIAVDSDSNRLAGQVSEGLALLALYRPPGSGVGPSSPSVRLLPSAQQRDLSERVIRLTAALVHATMSLADRSAGGDEAARRRDQARDLLDFAESWAQSPGDRWLVQRQRAAFHETVGESTLAASLRAELGPAPGGPDAVMLRFAEAYRRGEFRRGLAMLADGEAAAGHRADYWYARGKSEMELGRAAHAVAAYQTAIGLATDDDADLIVARAQAYLEAGQMANALRDFDRAIALAPSDVMNHIDRAVVKLRLKDFDGALADLDRAMSRNPGHTRSWFIRRQVRLLQRDTAGAARDAAEGLRHPPGDEMSWVTRGTYRLGTGDARGAIEDFDRALALNPKSRRALQNKANALAERLNRPDDAIGVLTELVEAYPDYGPARAGRGVLRARLGRRDEAIRDAKDALERDDSAFTKYQVAGIYALTSKTKPEDRSQALRLLAMAFRSGIESALTTTDSDLDPLRNVPEFQKLIDSAKTMEQATRP